MRLWWIFLSFLLITSNGFVEVFTDDLQQPVVVNLPVKRLISLAPSVTECLFALGVGEQVVGVTRYCNYPAAAAKITKIGDFSNPNLEVIVTLQPDLIVATADGNDKNKVEKLKNLGYPIYVLNANNLEETLVSLERLGAALGKKDTAGKLVAQMRQKEKLLREKIKDKTKPKIFFEIGSAFWTVSNTTFLGDLIRQAGAVNIVGDDLPSRYAMVNIETIMERQPEIIIISSMANAAELPGLKRDWERWPTIPAVKNGRVYIIQSDIVNRAGPRIVDALEQLINIIHFSK